MGTMKENYKKHASLSLFNPLTTKLTESAGGTEPTLRPGEPDFRAKHIMRAYFGAWKY